MNGRPSNSCSQGRNSKCHDKATESLCSGCLLCILCPLTVVWCCINLPFKVGWHAAQHARHWACGSEKKTVYASDSTSSDIDLDNLPGKPHTLSMGAPRRKMAHTDMAKSAAKPKSAATINL